MNQHNTKEQSLFQSESPDPSLIQAIVLEPEKDYKSQSWKNGLGMTDEIAIYPAEKNFVKDDFFWRFSTNLMQADCNFSVFPGYDCTTILLPGKQHKQPTLSLSHLGTESTTKFMLRRKLGKAQIRIEKIGAFETDLQGDVDSGKNMLFGAFAMVYVVEGVVSVKLDENHAHRQNFELVSGQTLYIERDEDASPTSILLNAIHQHGQQDDYRTEASIILIQVEEGKTFGGVLPKQSTSEKSVQRETPKENHEKDEGIVPSQRRPSLRRPSLLVPMERDQNKIIAPTAANTMPPDLPDKLSQLDRQASHETPGRSTKRRDSLNLELFDPNAIYEPPPFALIHSDTQMPPPVIRDKLEVEDFPLSAISTAWIKMMTQGLSEWLKLPVIVCRGSQDGVISQIDISKLKGTIVAVPCVNVWGYLKFQREFADGRDLNRQFPGKEDGYASQVFCYHLMTKIISQFNYMVDLHTASFGRVNSYYVRADMNDPVGASMAKLQQPQILLHNSGQDGTLRSAAAARGIKAITVEIGNPQTFQDIYIQWSFMGIMRIMDHFGMYSLQHINASEPITLSLSSKELAGPSHTVLCSRGFWIYTKTGGILEVYPNVNTLIRKGDIIARIKNMFGNIAEEYFAPCTGVVIGRSSNPVAMAGDRIVHMGIIKRTDEVLAKAAKENY
ncbi:hypothetical protein BD560DRAFT_321264 [Blakeslea trispora]|nr:hypothetical protein BD560DRAFT_321264 [Blakeslea trispora]